MTNASLDYYVQWVSLSVLALQVITALQMSVATISMIVSLVMLVGLFKVCTRLMYGPKTHACGGKTTP